MHGDLCASLSFAGKAAGFNFFKPNKQKESVTLTQLVNRTLEIIGKALEINGLNLEECENKGATREQLYKGIKKIFEKFTVGNFKPIVVGHNSGFDIGFLNDLFLEFEDDFGNYREMYFVCTKFQMFQRYPNLAAHSLKACCSKFNIVNEKSHTALSDTLATAKLLVELSKEAVSSIELSEEERIVKFSF